MKARKVEVEKPTYESQRQNYFTTFWCQQEYKNKYGVVYPWNGKEAKLLQRVLSYMDANVGKKEAHLKLEEAMCNYLGEENEYLNKEKHPFSVFASKPHKYFKPIVRSSERTNIERKPIKPPQTMTDDQWTQKKAELKVFLSKIGKP